MRYRILKEGNRFYPQVREFLSWKWQVFPNMDAAVTQRDGALWAPTVSFTTYEAAVNYLEVEQGVLGPVNHANLTTHKKRDGLLLLDDEGACRFMTRSERFAWWFYGRLPTRI